MSVVFVCVCCVYYARVTRGQGTRDKRKAHRNLQLNGFVSQRTGAECELSMEL